MEAPDHSKAAAGSLRAGVGKSDITTDAQGRAIRDPLYARALALDDGATRIVIVAMDTTAISGRRISQGMLNDVGEQFLPRLRQRIEDELKIPGSHVLVNASHTHPPGRLLCDDDEQVARTFEAVSMAVRNMTPAKVGAGWGTEGRISINRTLRMKNGRHWTIRHANPCPPDDAVAELGPIDPQIGVLRIDRSDGRPLAVLYNFACHLLFADARGSVTANFPAAASKLIEQTLGHDAIALFIQGACGDVIDVLFKDFERPRDVDAIGSMLGLSTLEAVRQIKTANAKLKVVSKHVELPRRTDIPQRIATLRGEQSELLASLRSTSLNFKSFLPLYLRHALDPQWPSDYSYRYLHEKQIGSDERLAEDDWNRRLLGKYLRNIHAMERLAVIQEDIATLQKHQQINDDAGGPTVAAEVQGMRIGDFVLLAAPIEVLTQVSLNVKKASPHRYTCIAGFSNGYLHYGAPAEDYDKGGYEVTECLLGPQWQAIFEKTAAEILRNL